jgi:hypothetical protein
MKRLRYTVTVTLALIVIGFVIVGFVQSKTELKAAQEDAVPTLDKTTFLPTALVGFPDIEHVPIYPEATVTFTNTDTTKRNHITYQVEERMDRVAEFYQKTLPKKNWLLRSGQSKLNLYSWSDPGGNSLWGMYLRFDIELALDESKAVVYLEYGRYPNTEAGLLLYPDAQQVSVTNSIIEKTFPLGKTPVRVTEITYLSSGSSQEIATFYTNAMQEYGWLNREPGWSTHEHGWFPFDNPGVWEGSNRQEGLYFVGWRPNWGEKPGVSYSYHLRATATVQEDRRILIKLHVEEYESSLTLSN